MAVKLSQTNITAAEHNGNTVCFRTDSNADIYVTAVSAKALEVWVDFQGTGIRNKSYSIDVMPNFSASFSSPMDRGSYFLLSAGKAAVRVYKNGVRLVYVSADDTQVICEGKEIGCEDGGAVYMHHHIAENEHFYGLGEDNDGYLGSMDRRGHTRDMITGQRINIGRVTADIPVTFYMSTGSAAPYGIFTDNSYPMYYDMGKENPRECFQRALGGDMVFYYFCGDDFGDILNEYTNLTGKPPMPPLWTQGYIQCRCSYWNWEQVDELIAAIRGNRIPLDCIVFDYDWAEHFNNYKWNPRWQGRSPEKIAQYRKQGLHFMVSNSGPMLKKNSDTYQSALDAGVLARDTGGNTITCGHYGGDLIDFSNPATKEWLRPQLERILDDGVESWWLDLTEPEGDPENTVYYAGERNKVHNPFSLLNTRTYTQITQEHCPNMRPFILTRTGTAGIQKYCTAIWSGDVYSDYKTFTAHIPEALNTAMSGIPLWTSDAGGFISSTNNAIENRNIYQNDVARHANLYERWVQFACFSPIMRVHHAGESAPYAFGDRMTSSIAHYIRLRYKLLPYIYSYAYRTHLTGEPLIRPLVYAYPQDENVYDLADEYLFGEELLVAPVHEEEQSHRKVYLPEGKWFDLDFGYVYEGKQWIETYAPQNRIPVFVRAGSIIPVSAPIGNTSELDRNTLSAEIHPAGSSRFLHYIDDGVSMDYEKGIYTLTELSCEETVGCQTIIRTDRSNQYFPAENLRLKLFVNALPAEVTVNGCAANRRGHLSELEQEQNGWFYDDFSRVLFIKANIAPARSEVRVAYQPDSRISLPSRESGDTSVSGQSPFILPAASVPCHVGFENFDRGGEGVAYHKHSPDNTDGIYRGEDVRIDTCDDIGSGMCVKNLCAGEWIEYTVQVLAAGRYCFKLRLQAEENSSLCVFTGEKELFSQWDVSGQRWHDAVSASVVLETGEQTIRFFVSTGKINGNYFEINEQV